MRKKIRNCMAILAGTAILFACADNNNDSISPIDPVEEGTEASLLLKLSNETAFSRALDDIDPNDLTQSILKINGSVNVYFFTATGKLVASDYVAAASLATPGKTYDHTTYNITTAVREVVIIGNVGQLTGVTNKSSLHAKLNSLEAAQNDYTKATPDIWVYGATTDITWGTTEPTGVTPGSCSLDLNPILSRIDVTVSTNGITDGYNPADLPNSNVDFKGVAVLYSGAYTHYIPSFIPTMSEITGGGFSVPMRSGIMDTAYDLWTTASSQVSLLPASTGTESLLNATWSGQWNGNDNFANAEFTRSFYAFPTSTANGYYDRNTIVTVYGDYNSNPGEAANQVTPLFWAVHFTSTQALNTGFATELQNGYVYKLNINLKGDYSEGGPGTVDPETPSDPADLDVVINQVKWKAIINMAIDFEG